MTHKSMGKWSAAEEALVVAGAPTELIMERTGRTKTSVHSKRSELNRRLGERIREKSYMRFINEEKAALREKKKEEKKRSLTIAEIRAKRTFQKVIPETPNPQIDTEIREMMDKANYNRAEAADILNKVNPVVPTGVAIMKEEIDQALGKKTWKEVAPGAGYICVEGKDSEITAPSPDELFFQIGQTKVTVSAGTKKVDILPHGLIIEF